MIIKAFLFDLDGVVVDTAHFHYLAWKNVADRLGFEFTESDNERLKGVSRTESLRILLEIGKRSLSEEDKIRLAKEKNQIYLTYLQRMTVNNILPGVKEFLTEMKNSGMLLGLGSASKNARNILRRTRLDSIFDSIVDGNLVSHAKPHPEIYTLSAELLHTDAANCIVFEDAIAGIHAAHNAGMKCVGVGSANILKDADMVIPGFKNLKLADIVFK